METETRQCNKCKQDFVLEQDDFSFYEKMKVPAPNVCPDCRFKMRAMWRNEITLYSGRKCGMCGKSVLSMYNPKSPYIIYCYDCFYSEKWDPRDYAMEYDKSKSFIEQMNELLIKVPKINLGISFTDGSNLNSEYTNMAGGCKNCYLVFNTSPAEDLLYSRGIKKGSFSSDIYFGVGFENCYECVNIQESANILWGQNVTSCVDSFFILNGSGLINCFGCINLRNKSNCWFNEHLSPEEYSKRIKEIKGSYLKTEEARKKFIEFSKTLPRRANNNLKTVNSTGDYLIECKNVHDSFEVAKSEDCRHIFSSKMIKDSLGTIGFGTKSEKLLEVVATGYCSNIIGSYWAENCSNILNCFDIRNCHDCIGCDALKNGKYSILNKEYSKEEYEELKEHIIKELTENGIYGLIMPPEISPFAYNETIAQDNMPLSKEEALAQGFKWQDDIQMTTRKETILPNQIPDHIKDVQDSITKEILRCIDCERNYKITEQELLFYKKMILPIPRKCFFCRHKDRIGRRGSMKFFIRKCSNCSENTYTNLTEEIAPIMYCEKCYQREII
ncbi:hypothetical protein KKB58_01615 [Patescibacteria group bacterium]|nr:hypothetical protein [Patescibacteria group bacterium]